MEIVEIEPIFLAVLNLHFFNFFCIEFLWEGIDEICRLKFTGATSGAPWRNDLCTTKENVDTAKETNPSTRR